MNENNLYDHPGWKWCTSEGAEMDSLLRGFEMSLIEKLEWLEEMEALKLHSESYRRALTYPESSIPSEKLKS